MGTWRACYAKIREFFFYYLRYLARASAEADTKALREAPRMERASGKNGNDHVGSDERAAAAHVAGGRYSRLGLGPIAQAREGVPTQTPRYLSIGCGTCNTKSNQLRGSLIF
eukprot:scaffold14323_cov101-Isochrysis_galbana.AAC.4